MKNNIETFTNLNVTTRETKPTLWVFGCSHSYGKGLKSGEKNYGTLLSEMLGMPLKLIAYPGSSTHFSLRHLVNANIKEDDIVIWQLTTAERFTYKEDGVLREVILPGTPELRFLNFYSDDQLFFQQISLLNIGAMYLRAKKVKFAIISIESGILATTKLITEYVKYPEYCMTDMCSDIDKGTDKLHVGPLTHKKISEVLFNHIQTKSKNDSKNIDSNS